MNPIYAYTDYREYIHDYCTSKREKNSGYSLRCAADRCGVPSGTFTRILNGTRGIGPSLLPKFIEWLGLKNREADYFRLLVKFQQCTNAADKETYHADILALRQQMRHRIPEETYHFFEQWYYVALYELIKIIPCGVQPALYGTYLEPPISEAKTVKALEILEKSGLIERTDKGYRTAAPFISTGDHWESTTIQVFQRMMGTLGTEALLRFPKSERDISTLSVSLSKESFRKVADIIREAREKIIEIERLDSKPQQVYQVNFQLFPLSRTCQGEQ